MKDRSLFLLPVVFLLIACAPDRGHMEAVEIETEIPVLNVYEGKIVYTTDMQADPKPFREDCQRRGGVFNACGDVCEPGASFCAEVCAYTCELGGKKSSGTEPGGGDRNAFSRWFPSAHRR